MALLVLYVSDLQPFYATTPINQLLFWVISVHSVPFATHILPLLHPPNIVQCNQILFGKVIRKPGSTESYFSSISKMVQKFSTEQDWATISWYPKFVYQMPPPVLGDALVQWFLNFFILITMAL